MVQTHLLNKSSTQARPGSARLGLTQASLGSNLGVLRAQIRASQARQNSNKALECDICDKTFPNKASAKQHAEIYHLAQAKCEICTTAFNQLWQLNHHMAISHANQQIPRINSVTILGKSR